MPVKSPGFVPRRRSDYSLSKTYYKYEDKPKKRTSDECCLTIHPMSERIILRHKLQRHITPSASLCACPRDGADGGRTARWMLEAHHQAHLREIIGIVVTTPIKPVLIEETDIRILFPRVVRLERYVRHAVLRDILLQLEYQRGAPSQRIAVGCLMMIISYCTQIESAYVSGKEAGCAVIGLAAHQRRVKPVPANFAISLVQSLAAKPYPK